MKNKNLFIPFLIVPVLFVATSCDDNKQNNENTTVKEKAQTTEASISINYDKDFVMKIGEANMTEVELGKMVQTKTTNKEVKAFAQQMVKDHTEAQTELKKIAMEKKITFPDKMSDMQMETKKKLMNLKGSELDHAYIKSQVEGHQKAVEEFQKEIKDGKDKDLMNFATKTLPHVQMHLEKAKSLQSTTSKM